MKLQGRPNAELQRGRVAASPDRVVVMSTEQQVDLGTGDVQIRQEANPVPSEYFVTPDNLTITGVGIGEDPLRTIAGGTAVVADDVTIGGDGTTGDPLHALFPGFYEKVEVATDGVTIGGTGLAADPVVGIPSGFDDKVRVLTDGTTIVGSGVTGDPLIATGSGPGTTNVFPFSYTVLGTEPDLLNLVVPVIPGQPDGDYEIAVSQGLCAFFLGMQITAQTGAHVVLSLSYPATAGDVFEFVLARAA